MHPCKATHGPFTLRHSLHCPSPSVGSSRRYSLSPSLKHWVYQVLHQRLFLWYWVLSHSGSPQRLQTLNIKILNPLITTTPLLYINLSQLCAQPLKLRRNIFFITVLSSAELVLHSISFSLHFTFSFISPALLIWCGCLLDKSLIFSSVWVASAQFILWKIELEQLRACADSRHMPTTNLSAAFGPVNLTMGEARGTSDWGSYYMDVILNITRICRCVMSGFVWYGQHT